MKEKKQRFSVYSIVTIGILSAVAYVLQFIEFSIPIMPGFIKFDLSDIPALIGSLALGPAGGVLIALIKNVLHLTVTSTGGVGELSNFILNALYVIPVGFIYKKNKSRKMVIAGAMIGAVLMTAVSLPSNYFVVYPFYYNFMPEDVIVAAYQAIFPGVKNILQCLIVFNMPFTFVKALIGTIIVAAIYKRLIPILTLERRKNKRS